MRPRTKKTVIYGSIFFIVTAIGAYFRLFPLLYYASSESSEKATVLVISRLKERVLKEINYRNPSMPIPQKKMLYKKNFDELLRAESKQVRQTIKKLARTIEKQSDSPTKYPYLLASDSFYYYNLTENIIADGRIGDTIKGSKYLNTLMLAPLGHWEPFNLHPYVGFSLFKFLQLFNPDIPLMFAVSFTPLIISLVSLIPFLLLCAYARCNPITSFIASVFYICAPIFVKRSSFGWYDNDPYNTLFPLLILLTLSCGIVSYKSIKHSALWGIACALTITAYALFWHGWMLFFIAAIISILLISCYFLWNKKDAPPIYAYAVSLLCLVSCVLGGITFIYGTKEFFILFSEGWKALQNFLSPQLNIWPDLYLSVGELKNSSLDFISRMTGGKAFMTISVLGIIKMLYDIVRKRNTAPFFICILSFLAATLAITAGAQRFVLLSLIPLSLCFAVGIQRCHSIMERMLKLITGRPPWKKILSYLPSLILLALIAMPLYTAATSTQQLLNTIFNKTWEETLLEIRVKTDPKSIISSWWPPGHFISSTAKRRVTFDGATINYPQAYWMANVFLSPDEKLAAGIIGMLNIGGNTAADLLTHNGLPVSLTVKTLKTILTQPKKQAKEFLTQHMDATAAESLIQLTHSRPPPSYLLIYQEMAENIIQFKFIGNWNFAKIEQINDTPEAIKAVPPRNSKDYIAFLWTLAGGAPKISEPLAQISETNNIRQFQHNIFIDKASFECTIKSPKFGTGTPRNILYLNEEGAFTTKNFPNATLNYSLILFQEGQTYKCILMDGDMAQSLLVRLFYFKGAGLKYFIPFSEHTDLTGRTRIYVYKIDWDRLESDRRN